jgi:site-specific DNA recombinase
LVVQAAGMLIPDLQLDLGLVPVRPDAAGDDHALTGWASRRGRRRPVSTLTGDGPGGLRFAFYGRMSTREFQDRASSRSWQRDSANELIAGRGEIAGEFFDVGCTRRLPWARRPQAARLLEAVTDPDRGFDAIVIGECERAFCGGQLLAMAPIFTRHGVQIWLPEVDGPIDFTDPVHRVPAMQLGARSRQEVLRSRYRTIAAIRAQARDQGRYLGGRPPYGYRLVDAGPHPNAAHARWGAAACNAWIVTRRPPSTSPGCSANVWPGAASPGSPGP